MRNESAGEKSISLKEKSSPWWERSYANHANNSMENGEKVQIWGQTDQGQLFTTS